jgi:hypothetical protein
MSSTFIGSTNYSSSTPQWDGTKWVTNTVTTNVTFTTNTFYLTNSNILNTWNTVFDVDCTTQVSTSITGSGDGKLLFGYNWIAENFASNVDSFGILPGVGLVLDPNGTNTNQSNTVYTSPSLFLPITRAISDFDINEHELRLWALLEVTGANADTELTKMGIARYSNTGNPTAFYFNCGKGFSTSIGGSALFFDFIYNSAFAASINTTAAPTHNVFMLHLKDHRGGDFYTGPYSATASFPNINDLNLNHRGSITAIGSNPTMITSSNGYSIMLTAFPGAAGNSFQATYRRLKLEYRRKRPYKTRPPIYSYQILNGVTTSFLETTSSMGSIGMMYYEPSIINAFSGSKSMYFKAILDTAELPVTATLGLYDYNGITNGYPGFITGSIISTSRTSPTYVTANITSQLLGVTGSGILEGRLWRVAGTTLQPTSSVYCRNASLDIFFV